MTDEQDIGYRPGRVTRVVGIVGMTGVVAFFAYVLVEDMTDWEMPLWLATVLFVVAVVGFGTTFLVDFRSRKNRRDDD